MPLDPRPFDAWLDLVGELMSSTHGFPRRLLAKELARAFHAHVLLEWSDPDGAHGVEELGTSSSGPLQLAIPYRRTATSYRAFVLTRPSFTEDEVELAGRLQPLLALLDRRLSRFVEHDPAEALTERERSVVELLSEGLTAAAIAHRLEISPRTVHVHLRNVYRKFGVSDRLLAARIYRDSRRYAALA